MRDNLVRVPRSGPLQIPAKVLRKGGLRGTVRSSALPGRVVIAASRRARAGWAEAFRRMARLGDDAPVAAPAATAWDRTEWEW